VKRGFAHHVLSLDVSLIFPLKSFAASVVPTAVPLSYQPRHTSCPDVQRRIRWRWIAGRFVLLERRVVDASALTSIFFLSLTLRRIAMQAFPDFRGGRWFRRGGPTGANAVPHVRTLCHRCERCATGANAVAGRHDEQRRTCYFGGCATSCMPTVKPCLRAGSLGSSVACCPTSAMHRRRCGRPTTCALRPLVVLDITHKPGTATVGLRSCRRRQWHGGGGHQSSRRRW